MIGDSKVTLDCIFNVLDSDSASGDDSYNEYEKVSFNDQLRTVQLQRKVQFLQEKN